MSRIGKQSVFIPSSVQLQQVANTLIFQGPAGAFQWTCTLPFRIRQKGSRVDLFPLVPRPYPRSVRAGWGTLRTGLFQMSYGLAYPFQSTLQLLGVGFKVFKKKEKLILKLGLSHRVFLELPAFSSLEVRKTGKRPPRFLYTSPDYAFLRNLTFFLRTFKKPDPYKGKGFSFPEELRVLKEGKKVKN